MKSNFLKLIDKVEEEVKELKDNKNWIDLKERCTKLDQLLEKPR